MPPKLTNELQCISNVRLPGQPSTWDIQITYPTPGGKITSVTPHQDEDTDEADKKSTPSNPTSNLESEAPLVLPALTHPHIHLDKAFIHSTPKYAPFLPSTGTFHEALSNTTKAKKQFTHADLLKRGEWLLSESLAAGVTAMRAFVEVDHTVQQTCLKAALELKEKWAEAVQIQIVCFAQDPIFSTEHGEENMRFVSQALDTYPQIDVLGTTPYVEASAEAAKQNIDWAIGKALEYGLHLDFHLDYNLDRGKEALVWYVLRVLRERGWTRGSTGKRVMLGHCSRLTLFGEGEWARLAREIRENDLPVSFVGLPTSDLYMAAPPAGGNGTGGETSPQVRPRGTLQILDMIREYGLDAVMGVNNVGNSFTPWGLPDPLALACLGVGVYQAGSQADAELLFECVSTRARAAIGLDSGSGSGLCVQKGERPDLLLVCCRDDTGCGIVRPRTNAAEVVWTPPEKMNRDVICGGRLKISPYSTEDVEELYRYL
jgi:cytosine/adenosine deaminase-related metal-dependent hydrolase